FLSARPEPHAAGARTAVPRATVGRTEIEATQDDQRHPDFSVSSLAGIGVFCRCVLMRACYVRKRRAHTVCRAYNDADDTRFHYLLPRTAGARCAFRRALFRRRVVDADLLPPGLHGEGAQARELPILY